MLLHGGQGGTSLEYQTYTSAHPFDTIVAGLGGAVVRRGEEGADRAPRGPGGGRAHRQAAAGSVAGAQI